MVTAEDEPVGPAGLAFLNGQLYLLTAAGGWDSGDPSFHNALYRVSEDGDLEQIFDYSQYLLQYPTRSRLEDPRADVPMGMPFGLAALGDRLYASDGNQEQVLAISPTGEATRVVEYPKSNRALTGLAAGPDGALYIAEYAANQVSSLMPDGQLLFVLKMQVPIAVAFDPASQLYVLEYRLGRVVRLTPDHSAAAETIVDGLVEATAMTFGPDGNLYISANGGKQRTDGVVIRVDLPRDAAYP
jgi:hypothetical protein